MSGEGAARPEVDWEWTTGWSADEPLTLPDRLLRSADAPWVSWPGTGLEGRDLGLERNSEGRLGAQHVRATGVEEHGGDWHCYDLDLEFLYVVAGMLVLRTRDGTEHPLGPGSSFLHPPFFWHQDVYRSGDLEVVRITSGAQGDRFDGTGVDLPDRADHLPEGRAAAYLHPAMATATVTDQVGDVVWHLGTGPLTGGRVNVQVRSRPDGGAVLDHGAPVGAWMYVVSGVAELAEPAGAHLVVLAGDALSNNVTAAPGWRLLATSSDFASIELRLGSQSARNG